MCCIAGSSNSQIAGTRDLADHIRGKVDPAGYDAAWHTRSDSFHEVAEPIDLPAPAKCFHERGGDVFFRSRGRHQANPFRSGFDSYGIRSLRFNWPGGDP